jgi:DNA gyrase subunit B
MSQSEQVIRLLEDRDHCRLRPGMYIPNINYSVYELVDNAVDQYMIGNGDTINVLIDEDGSLMVQDFGAGLPIGPSQDIPEMSQAELALSRLQAGGKFEDNGIKSAGLNGVGASCINFLSEYFYTRISKQGKLYGLDFEQGLVVNQLYEMEDEDDEYPENGTLIMLKPDEEIWAEIGNTFDISAINRRLKQLAYLNPGLTINFQVNNYNGQNVEESYFFEEGVKSYVEELTENKDLILDPIYVSKEVDGIEVSIALAYTEAVDHVILGFTNNVPNTDNKSSHLSGLKAGLSDVVKDYQVEVTSKLKNPITAEDTREGVVAVVSVKVASPNYIGQGKDYLNMPSVRKAVSDVIKECMEDYIDKNPNNAKLILEKALEAQRVRETVRKAKETARKTKGMGNGPKPEKLVKCVSKTPEESVIWLVEGDSAAGSAKQARNEQCDAIFPAFGKINNTYGYTLDKIFSSSKILDVVKILECGIGEDFDMEKLRYHKIISLSDADVDGLHIQCLWATFFWKHMPQIIENGMFYLAVPPLYGIKQGKDLTYVYSDSERDELIASIEGKYEVFRYKGLGEMNWKELRESTMAEDTRRLIQITPSNIEWCEQVLDVCMNDKSIAARKEFITSEDTYDLV